VGEIREKGNGNESTTQLFQKGRKKLKKGRVGQERRNQGKKGKANKGERNIDRGTIVNRKKSPVWGKKNPERSKIIEGKREIKFRGTGLKNLETKTERKMM